MNSLVSPFFAISKQLRPITSLAWGFAPSRTRVSIVLLCPFCAAMWRGVARLKSVEFRSQPALASAMTDSSTWFVEPIGGHELIMTQWSGVNPPVRSVAFGAAPRSNRQRTTSSRACLAAWCSAVISFASAVSSPTPFRRASSTPSRSPPAAAARNSFSSGVRDRRRGGARVLRRRRKFRRGWSPIALFFLILFLMLVLRRSTGPERRNGFSSGSARPSWNLRWRSVTSSAGLGTSVPLTVALLLPMAISLLVLKL